MGTDSRDPFSKTASRSPSGVGPQPANGAGVEHEQRTEGVGAARVEPVVDAVVPEDERPADNHLGPTELQARLTIHTDERERRLVEDELTSAVGKLSDHASLDHGPCSQVAPGPARLLGVTRSAFRSRPRRTCQLGPDVEEWRRGSVVSGRRSFERGWIDQLGNGYRRRKRARHVRPQQGGEPVDERRRARLPSRGSPRAGPPNGSATSSVDERPASSVRVRPAWTASTHERTARRSGRGPTASPRRTNSLRVKARGHTAPSKSDGLLHVSTAHAKDQVGRSEHVRRQLAAPMARRSRP